MLKRLIPAVVLVAGLVAAGALAQKRPEDVKAKEIVYEKEVAYRIFAAPEAVRAFAVQGNHLWYAIAKVLFYQPINAKQGQQFRDMAGIPATDISAIVIDGQGQVWVAAAGGVAVRKGNNFTAYTSANGLPEGAVHALAMGAHGDIWAGTENGAARFAGGSWTKYTTAEGLPSNKVQALVGDSRGNMYIGTNKGLSVYDGSKFTNHNNKNTGSTGLDWNNITVLAKEPGGDAIWMTDGPKNLNRFSNGKWERFMEIHEGITSIMNDGRWTWFGSPTGVLRFNGEEWVSDAATHGVVAQEIYAMFRDAEGRQWFGMEKGVMMRENPVRR
ncbi:MAG: hypothetical protein FWB85_03800 [Chitinispirillia bacterium]|nr:hypothetical protein [Chitinispirillia bacterium]MCL2241499.1 hypothetical protein [Chitinispirillia bacterium]